MHRVRITPRSRDYIPDPHPKAPRRRRALHQLWAQRCVATGDTSGRRSRVPGCDNDAPPKMRSGWFNLGQPAARNRGAAAKRFAAYRTRPTRLQPATPEILNNLGVQLYDCGAVADALKHYDAALAIRPDFTDAIANRGQRLAAHGPDGGGRKLRSVRPWPRCRTMPCIGSTRHRSWPQKATTRRPSNGRTAPSPSDPTLHRSAPKTGRDC